MTAPDGRSTVWMAGVAGTAHFATRRDLRPPRAMACGTWVERSRPYPAASIPDEQRCRRPGCRGRWEHLPEPTGGAT